MSLETFGVVTGSLFLVCLIILLVVFGPLLSIWALNTLFPVLAIPYTWKTWLAIIVFGGLFKTNITTTKKD
jgi:hypothetical protein